MLSEIIIFDRRLKRLHKERAARLIRGHDFLAKEAATRLAQHLEDITREFTLALDLGTHGEFIRKEIETFPNIKKIIRCDSSLKTSPDLVADEEFIPFAENSFDLVLSSLALHWVNDLPGSLIQINHILKKDGLFIASLFGGETLNELRRAIIEAEMDKGLSPRISPFADIKSAAGLLQRTGFSMPVADSEKITVLYRNAFQIMHDLRGMGETNALVKRRKNFTTKAEMAAIAEKYKTLFADSEGLIPATFEIITLTGSKG